MSMVRKLIVWLVGFEISQTSVRPDDIVVLRVSKELSLPEALELLESFKDTLPNNTCVLLNGGASLEIIRTVGLDGTYSIDYIDAHTARLQKVGL